MKTLKDLPLEEKRALYTSWIDELHDQKVEETRRKVARFGYTDEDDYHFLTPPEGYDWHPRGDTPNGDFHGYDGWSENYRDMVRSFPPVVVPQNSMAGNFFRILQKFRKLRWHENWDLSPWQELIDRYCIDHGLGQMHHLCGDVRIAMQLGWGGWSGMLTSTTKPRTSAPFIVRKKCFCTPASNGWSAPRTASPKNWLLKPIR